MSLSPQKATTITTSALVLHNYLRKNNRSVYTPFGFIDYVNENGNLVQGAWRSDQVNPLGVFSSAI